MIRGKNSFAEVSKNLARSENNCVVNQNNYLLGTLER